MGNTRKHESYVAAWERIQAAEKAGFFLEAVAIQESMISDRLISFLARPNRTSPITKDKWGNWPSLGALIAEWREDFPGGLPVSEVPDLIAAVDQWRKARNEMLHTFVKSDPGTATTPVSDFLLKAKQASTSGTHLARVVSDWHRRASPR